MTMIKDLKKSAAGTAIRGLALMIKTARKPFKDANGDIYQEVVFMDASGEMTGHIFIDNEATRWKSKTNLCIMNGELQFTDERGKESNKLVVFECFDAATPLGYDQVQDLQAEDWKKLREDEIKGKIRHGQVCAYIKGYTNKVGAMPSVTETIKKTILEWQEFVLNGE